nr:hypothetical protein GCM10025730_36460 [Promicromonospora thailandica]
MQYRTLDNGHTSFEVSALCLGTMYMGTRTDEETSFAILDRFVEAGGTFLDTANNYNAWVGGYGRDSEDVIGRWLAARGNRDELRIATKLGAAKKDPDLPLSTTPPTNYQGLAASTVDAEARESLRHLGTDHVDVLYGHVDDRETPLEETVGAFGKLVDEGLVGIPGISNVALWRLVEARETAARLGVAPYGAVQQCHSYVYPRPQPVRTSWATPELLDYAASTGTDGRPGLTVLAYSPLHQGCSSGTTSRSTTARTTPGRAPGSRRCARWRPSWVPRRTRSRWRGSWAASTPWCPCSGRAAWRSSTRRWALSTSCWTTTCAPASTRCEGSPPAAAHDLLEGLAPGGWASPSRRPPPGARRRRRP